MIEEKELREIQASFAPPIEETREAVRLIKAADKKFKEEQIKFLAANVLPENEADYFKILSWKLYKGYSLCKCERNFIAKRFKLKYRGAYFGGTMPIEEVSIGMYKFTLVSPFKLPF